MFAITSSRAHWISDVVVWCVKSLANELQAHLLRSWSNTFKHVQTAKTGHVIVGITRRKIVCGVLRIYWPYSFCTFTLFGCFDRLWPLHFQTPSIPGDGKTRGWWILTKSSFDRAGSESHRSTCEVSPFTGSLNQHAALNTEIVNLVFNLPIKHEQLYHAWGAHTFAETASRQVCQAGTPNKWL